MLSALLISSVLFTVPAQAQERSLADIGDGSIRGIGDLRDLPADMTEGLEDRLRLRPMVINGTDTDSYKEVVAFGLVYDGYMYGTFCSGTRIANKWILTASHCLDTRSYESKGFSMYVFVGGDVVGGDILDYSEWDRAIEHPDYELSDYNIEYDIGLVKTQDSLATYGNAAVVNDEALRNNTYNGEELLLVGFGLQGDGSRAESGVKQYAWLDYNSLDSQFIYTYESTSNACNGDSGGPLFEAVDEGNGREVTGVVSWGQHPDGTGECEGGYTAFTRVDQNIDFIETYVSVRTDHGGSDTDEPDEPEDDTEEPVDTEEPDDTDEPNDTDDGVDEEEDVDPSEAWDFDTPAGPSEGIYSRCAAVSGGAMWLGLALLPVVARRRRE